jgi:hypothetical protein
VVLIQGCFRDQMRSCRKRAGRFELDAYQQATAEVAKELDVPMLALCDALSEAGLERRISWTGAIPVPRACAWSPRGSST